MEIQPQLYEPKDRFSSIVYYSLHAGQFPEAHLKILHYVHLSKSCFKNCVMQISYGCGYFIYRYECGLDEGYSHIVIELIGMYSVH